MTYKHMAKITPPPSVHMRNEPECPRDQKDPPDFNEIGPVLIASVLVTAVIIYCAYELWLLITI